MKQKLFTLFLALAASVGTIFAVTIDGIEYDLNGTELTAEVISKFPEYSGEVIIPSSVNYNNQTYSVTSIRESAFFGCSGLTSVTIGNSVTWIGWSAFAGCKGLTSVTIPNSVTSIGERAFQNCTGLTSVTIPNSVTLIGWNAFYRCSGLTSVTIPNSVTEISYMAFYGCSGLTSVTIPNSVTSIGGSAFWGCTGLTSVTIPNSVTSIGDYAFNSCTGLTAITVDATNTNYCDVDGVLFNKEKTMLIQYPAKKNETEYTIPNSVTSIGERAFSGCSDLTSVTIPNSVTSIGSYAFEKSSGLTFVTIPNSVTSISSSAFAACKGLTSVTIPNSVTSIGNSAFWGCPGLTSVTIPNSVTSIGKSAFYDCTGLTSVTIPNSVTSIGDGAFWRCSGLTSVTCEAVTPPSCAEKVFDNVDKTIPIYVPVGSVDEYKKADQWKDFGDNIQPIQAAEADVTDIEAEPMDNSVVIEWPSVAEATIYTIEIRKNGELICTLTFNELGQLQSIAFAKPSRNGGRDSQVRTATQTTTGWKYTIGGLEANTTYSYNVIAKRNVSDTDNLYNKTITFTTKNTPTGIDEVSGQPSEVSTQKIMRNGQMLIERNGEVYNVQGARVK